MQNKRPPFLIIVLVIAILIAGGYYVYTLMRPASSSDLTASGTVEATEVLVAPELSGKVADVLVAEGSQVKMGDVLYRLDGTLLQAQRNAAAAALDNSKAAAGTAQAAADTARSQYDITLAGALAEQKANRSADWTAAQPTEFNQPAWYFDKSEQAAAAQAEVEAAKTALESAQNKLSSVEEKSASSDFLAAEKRLTGARASFDVAQNVLTFSASSDQSLRDSAQKIYDDAFSELDSAQKAYTNALTTSGAEDVLTARADLRVAQERYDTAQDKTRTLQTGELSLKVTAAQNSLNQALAAAAQAKTGVAQAEANLALIDAQIGKLTVIAPTDGIILTRAIEAGEVVMPGSGLLTMARLSDLTITVYIPEDKYGQLSVGQTATVKVDSFPGETFNATVTNISGQAQFTPRNVQTTEGRKTTVFAIKLSLADPGGKLKPGMPADVYFK